MSSCQISFSKLQILLIYFIKSEFTLATLRRLEQILDCSLLHLRSNGTLCVMLVSTEGTFVTSRLNFLYFNKRVCISI
jgi:hypothetical protein